MTAISGSKRRTKVRGRARPVSRTARAIKNPGKPLNQYRIRGLAFAANGKLYGVGQGR
jgi:hypothetical protein